MNDHIRVLELLDLKKSLEINLNSLVYGSIEIRNNKYIYCHIKEDGLQTTKYIGEYTEELYNLIINNNIKAKQIKKEIRKVEKELKSLNYVNQELPLNVSKNIDFARAHLVETIFKQAVLEGVSATLSDTKNIIEGLKISNVSSEDVLKIINLKHAWEFILNKNVIMNKTDYSVLSMINKLVEEGFYYNAGTLRSVPVDIGGTSWKPQIPIEADIKDDINNIINHKKSSVDIAIELLLYVCKKQMFIDGNKRTAVIFANHYLISKGKGLIVISEKKIAKFKKLLINYYEDNNYEEIFNFIKNECYIKI